MPPVTSLTPSSLAQAAAAEIDNEIRYQSDCTAGAAAQWAHDLDTTARIIERAIQRAIDAALSAATTSTTWQPISSAPRDGRKVLLRIPFAQFQNPEIQFDSTCGYWTKASPQDLGYWACTGWRREWEATHWMPMPPVTLPSTSPSP